MLLIGVVDVYLGRAHPGPIPRINPASLVGASHQSDAHRMIVVNLATFLRHSIPDQVVLKYHSVVSDALSKRET